MTKASGFTLALRLTDLVRRNGAQLVGYAAAHLGDRTEAEDVVQTVLVRLVERNESPRDIDRYVVRAIRNEIIDRRRADRPVVELTFEHVESNLLVLDARQHDEWSQVRALLQELKPDEREVIYLHYVTGLSMRAIARVLDQPLGSVASKHRRAIRTLRDRNLEGASYER